MSGDVADEKFVESMNQEPITCIRSAEGCIVLTIYSQAGDMNQPVLLDEENADRLYQRLGKLLKLLIPPTE